jgi:peptide/nickel transport system permease protein
MQTLIHIGERILHAVILLLAVVVLNFLLIHLAPGDVAQVIAGEMGGITEELLVEIRAQYGLDKSFAEQLYLHLARMVQLDFGHSYFYNQPVINLIWARLPATLLLVLASLALAVASGTVLGVISARRPNSFFSHLITVVAIGGYSTPVFWLGIVLLVLFASVVPLFPTGGMYDAAAQGGGAIAYLLDVAHHSVLPVVTLAAIYLAQYSRLARGSMLETLGADYIRTARAKGLSERVVVYKHALRNAILPVVTMAGLQFSQLFAGAILVETVFSWPGLGRLAFEAIVGRDYPTVLGLLFFSALIVVIANLLTDFCYRLIDPRIRLRGNR